MATVFSLDRADYMQFGQTPNFAALDYLSAKYKNIRQLLQPRQTYTVDASDRANAPGIAFKMYGSADYWWIVCLYNGIIDPISDLEPGLALQLPSLADINALLSSLDAQQLSSSTVTI